MVVIEPEICNRCPFWSYFDNPCPGCLLVSKEYKEGDCY